MKKTGCEYNDQNVTAPLSEQQAVEAYLSGQSITTAVKHSSGMYYQVITPGTGGTPGLCSQVLVAYSGKLTNGSQFDANTTAFTLGGTIVGFQKGVPLVQKGGHVKLYIPPSLGYGNVDVKNGNTVVIPANSILIFDITLTDFN